MVHGKKRAEKKTAVNDKYLVHTTKGLNSSFFEHCRIKDKKKALRLQLYKLRLAKPIT